MGLFTAPLLLFWSRPLILEFCFGMALALVCQRGLRISHVQGLLLIAASLVLVAVMMQTDLYVPESHLGDKRAIYYGLPALLFVAAFARIPRWAQNDSLAGRIARKLVESSYTLYLMHLFVIRICVIIWGDARSDQSILGVRQSCVHFLYDPGCGTVGLSPDRSPA